jgi:hypothetical protein
VDSAFARQTLGTQPRRKQSESLGDETFVAEIEIFLNRGEYGDSDRGWEFSHYAKERSIVR